MEDKDFVLNCDEQVAIDALYPSRLMPIKDLEIFDEPDVGVKHHDKEDCRR